MFELLKTQMKLLSIVVCECIRMLVLSTALFACRVIGALDTEGALIERSQHTVQPLRRRTNNVGTGSACTLRTQTLLL